MPRPMFCKSECSPSRGLAHTNADTSELLFGLCAVVQTVAQKKGVYSVSKGNVQDVRHQFIGGRPFTLGTHPILGRRNLKRKEAKHCVLERCRELGLHPETEDEADALALWHFECRRLRPSLTQPLRLDEVA